MGNLWVLYIPKEEIAKILENILLKKYNFQFTQFLT